MNREVEESVFRSCVEQYPEEVPPEKVEEELNLMILEMKHRMQYQNLASGSILMPTRQEMENQLADMKKEAYYAVKSELVLKRVMEQQSFTVTREELEQEAEAMAARQNTTVEMIRKFFGDDLDMLKQDLLVRKARAYVCLKGRCEP